MKLLAIRSSWFNSLSPQDGLFALLIGILVPFYIYFISSFGFDKGLMQAGQRSYVEIIFLTFIFIFLVLVILVFVKVKGQVLASTGLSWGRFTCKEKIVMLPLLVVLLTTLFFLAGGNSEAAWGFLFSFLVVGFTEEFLYRGFIHPRLVRWWGFCPGLIVTGILFGVAHAPLSILLYPAPDLFYILNSILNNIGGGIVGHGFFLWLFTRRDSLLLPVLVHGLLNYLGQLS